MCSGIYPIISIDLERASIGAWALSKFKSQGSMMIKIGPPKSKMDESQIQHSAQSTKVSNWIWWQFVKEGRGGRDA